MLLGRAHATSSADALNHKIRAIPEFVDSGAAGDNKGEVQ